MSGYDGAFDSAFALIGEVVAPPVVRLTSAPASAAIVLNGTSISGGTLARSYSEKAGNGDDPDQRHDIWFFESSRQPPAEGDFFERLRLVTMHEALHSLGLQHPHLEPPVDVFDPDNTRFSHPQSLKYTVMSYAWSLELGTQKAGVRPGTLQLYDIWALQEMYGLDTVTRAESGTVYGTGANIFDAGSSALFLATIWDAGGSHDRIDASGSSASAVIDLRQGEFSSIGATNSLSAPLENLAIAWRTVIEDATGTSQQDVIIGNIHDNVIDGGGGDDLIFGDGDEYGRRKAVAFQKAGLSVTAFEIDKSPSGEDWVGSGASAVRPNTNNSGDDRISGGAGADRIYGGRGNDEVDGGHGDDFGSGGDGDDLVRGGQGLDYLNGDDGNDMIFGDAGNDILLGGDGHDELYGGADDDKLYGGAGADKLEGGFGVDRLAGGDGDDTLVGGDGDDFVYGGAGDDHLQMDLGNDHVDGGAGWEALNFGPAEQPVNLSIRAMHPPGGMEAGEGTNGGGGTSGSWETIGEGHLPSVATTSGGWVQVISDWGTDALQGVELLVLSDQSDRVSITFLGDVDGDDPLAKFRLDFGTSPVSLEADMLDFSSAGLAGAWWGKDAGIKVDLRNAAEQTVQYYYLLAELPTGHHLYWTQGDLQLRAANANSVKGTEYGDWLIGNGGRWADGEGFSTLHGQGGNDRLQAAGRETHMFGGEGKDTFAIGANSWIEDAEAHDRVTYGGIPIFGGAKQWWMEGNTAAWAPFSTVMSGFPVIGAPLLTAAAFFVDVMTMKFASYQRDSAGNLVMVLGWGHGGFGIIKDYHLDLDSGIGSGGVTVFQAEWAGDFSGENLKKFVNLALKAGFGVGLGSFDPLVLDLDGDGFELTSEGNSRVYFEFDGDGFGERTGWVRGDDGLLARDANGNGTVDNVTELFGNRAQSGFAMLGAFDLNADGLIDVEDAVFAELRVWRDADQDGVSDPGELKTVSELGIVSISHASAAPAQPTAIGGNQIVRTGSFARADGTTGAVADVAFAINETATRWLGDSAISAAAAALPQLRGFGEIKDLRVAMTGDAGLQAMVSAFAANPTTDLAVLKGDAEAILYAWAGVAGVVATAIGSGGFDARKLAFLEKYVGMALMPRDAGGAVELTNLEEMETLWSDQLTRLTLRLVVQGPLAEEFAGIVYRADLDLLVAETPTALADLYGRLLADLPSDPAAALAEWQAWAPLLGAMAEGMRRFDANVVRLDYVAAQLLAAADGVVQPLSYAQLASALGIGELRIGTAAGETLARGDADGTVVHAGQGGNDLFDGGGGQDVYIFGRQIGHSIIDDEESNASGDRIRFAFLNPADVKLERSGHDLLITVKATGETVRVIGQFAPVVPLAADLLLSSNKGVEDIQFADGTVWEIPEIMTAVGTGTDGHDHIVGTMHSDVLIGGLGNDLLEGGDDADLYVIRGGDGQDVIRDVQTTPLLRAVDLLIFGDGIAPADLVFSRPGGGDDLLVTIGSSGQTLLIEDQFAYIVLGYNDRLAPNSRIEAFGFRNYGDSWSNRDVQQMLIGQATTAGVDEVLGFGDDDEFVASAGNDLMIGLDGSDRYYWGMGSGHDTIDERARFIDIKVGATGLSLVDEIDTVEFLAGIVRSGVKFSRPSEAPDLLVTILASGETLLVKNQFAGFQTGPFGAQWLDRIERFAFADGTSVSWQQVLLETTTGGAGDDALWGDLYADLLEGGTGNDTLSGRGYGDTYVYKPGDGHDTIRDANPNILGAGILQLDRAPDILNFVGGIAPADIGFAWSGFDLILTVAGATAGSVTLAGQDLYFHTGVFGAHSSDRIEEVHFGGVKVWDWEDLNRLAIAAATTSGDDYTRGSAMSDRFEMSAGNDILVGNDSADVYVFGPGAGHDIIRENVSNILYGDVDVVEFTADVDPTDVTFARAEANLVVTLASGDTLTIERQFDYSNWFQWWDVELFRFAGRTVEWTKAYVQQQLLLPTTGDDHLVGFMTDDDLDGGAGNDILEGGDGSDTYRFGYGSGHDRVVEWVGNANLDNNDRVLFAANVLPADVGLSRQGDDLVITLAGSGETLRIEGHFTFVSWFAWRDVERFEFADGTVWTDLYVAQRIMGGTAGPDHIIGTFRADTLDGGTGTDILEGGDGSDTYVFGRGYGHDEVRETVSNANLSNYDQVLFLDGVSLADLGFARAGDDLVVTILGTTDSLTVKDQFRTSTGYSWWDIERFAFADGTSIDKAGVQQIMLQGTDGPDHLVGFSTGDILDGGLGNDILEGGEGPDTYRFGFGYGQDEIREFVGYVLISNEDTLEFGAGVAPGHVDIARIGDDLIISLAGTTDTLTVIGQFNYISMFSYSWFDIELFRFADGTVWTKYDIQAKTLAAAETSGDDFIVGFPQEDVISGGAGNDTIEGGRGNDVLIGGPGNDILNGGRGADLYHFAVGDGADTINEAGNEFDAVVLGAGIAPSQVVVSAVNGGHDLRLTIGELGDMITLAATVTTSSRRVEEVRFADGTIWTHAAMLAMVTAGTPGDDLLVADESSNLLSGGIGNDTLDARGGNDTLIGGVGDDILLGGTGDDTYLFNSGDGQDIIRDHSGSGEGGFDTVQLGDGIAASDLIVTQADGGNDLLISIAGTGDSILLDDTLAHSDRRIERVAFADLTALTHAQLLALATAPTVGNDVFYGGYDADLLEGGAGNDTLEGRGGDDTLRGGTGNDVLAGGTGDDTYRFELGDGQDLIRDHSGSGGGGNDTILLGPGIAASHLVVTQTDGGNDLLISIGAAGDSILLDDANSHTDRRVEKLRLADGTEFSHTQLIAMATAPTVGNDIFYGGYEGDAMSGGAGDDTLDGREGNDTIAGGTGNDLLIGGAGDDTYIFNRGDGEDTLRDSSSASGGGSDVVQFGPTIASSDIVVTVLNGGTDLLLTLFGTQDRLLFDDTITNAYRRIEFVRFADGSVLTHADLMARANGATPGNDTLFGDDGANVLAGGAGSDTLEGRGGNDTLLGGTGNDILIGGQGDDTYVFELGDGQDIVRDYNGTGWGGVDTVQFGSGISSGDVIVTQVDNGNDFLLSVAGTSDSVLLDNSINDVYRRIENVGFGDASWTHATLMALATQPTDGADTFFGGYDSDLLQGGGGNDLLDARDGADTLRGGAGNDILMGGAGDDTYIFDLGDGQDIVRDYNGTGWGGTDVVQFGPGIDRTQVILTQADGGRDLLLSIAGTTDSILLDDAASNVYRRIETVRFHDGFSWSHADMMASVTQPTAGNDVFYGGYEADLLQGGAGDDTLVGNEGNDILIGGTGADLLQGGAGNDTYRFSRGDGADTVRDRIATGNNGGTDAIEFAADIAPSQVLVYQADGGNDLVLRIVGTTDEIILDQAFVDSSSQIEQVKFHGGTIWSHGELVSRAWAGKPTSDTYWGDGGNNIIGAGDGDDTLIGAGGDDTLYGDGGADTLYGDAGADRLYGQGGDDMLTGGAGNDMLDGWIGHDTARFAGLKSSYSLTTSGGSTYVIDNAPTDDGNDGTDQIIAMETLLFKNGETISLAAPIVLDLDGDGLDLVDLGKTKAAFDWNGDGTREATGWIGRGDGLLVYDRNGDGRVSGAEELSFVGDAPGARSDLEGLRAFDTNGDGMFSALDANWHAFRVWKDSDGDGVVDKGELLSMRKAGVASISLAGTPTEQSWSWGENLVINHGTFTRTNGKSGTIGDVALVYASVGGGGAGDAASAPWFDHPADHPAQLHQLAQLISAEVTPLPLGDYLM
jgi:Ca2+-binding RTX toxin-like protein